VARSGENMKNVNYLGIPRIQEKTPVEALDILYRHCDEMAQIVAQMNKEIEDLKDEVEELRSR
jgi:prefoldin subunit 5